MKPSECAVHKLVADVCLISGGHVLLARYRDTSSYDGQAGWFLPDDFLKRPEHPDDGAARILREQAGIEGPRPRLSHMESFEGHGFWHVIFHYVATLEAMPEVTAGENIRAIQWFPLAGLPPASEMAHHGWGLETIERVLAGRAA